jgi:hypothetical protein
VRYRYHKAGWWGDRFWFSWSRAPTC